MEEKRENLEINKINNNLIKSEVNVKPSHHKFKLFHRKESKDENTTPYIFADTNNPDDSKKNTPKTFKKRKLNWSLVLSVVSILLLSVFFVAPGLVGYSVYGNENADYSIDDLGKSVNTIHTELNNIKETNSLNLQLQEQLKDNTQQVITCSEEKNNLKNELENSNVVCEQKINSLTTELQVKVEELEKQKVELESKETQLTTECINDLNLKKSELEIMQEKYNAFVSNAARSTCCIKKFDNPAINGFEVRENKLVCLESEGTPLDCSFG